MKNLKMIFVSILMMSISGIANSAEPKSCPNFRLYHDGLPEDCTPAAKIADIKAFKNHCKDKCMESGCVMKKLDEDNYTCENNRELPSLLGLGNDFAVEVVAGSTSPGSIYSSLGHLSNLFCYCQKNETVQQKVKAVKDGLSEDEYGEQALDQR